jgi:hypothetical protein
MPVRAKSRHEPGKRCAFCNRIAADYTHVIRGTGQAVCDHCAPKHEGYVELAISKTAREGS